MKQSVRKIYQFVRSHTRLLKVPYWLLVDIAYRLNLLDVRKIPVVINNFNRLTATKRLVNFLEACGLTNIVILDNQSTYPPLLEYYRTCKHRVVLLDANYGHLAFWKSGLYRAYRWNYFVYTDSDVVPDEECPRDFLRYFQTILARHYSRDKVGFGIRIDDLPDVFDLKDRIIKYESRYWEKQIAPGLFDAPIDTTFALYRPFSNVIHGEVYTLSAWRTGPPYVVQHLPWYTDSRNPSEEETYYMRTSNSSSSIGQHQKGAADIY